jgi:uncharacterized membrane protein
LAVAREPSQGGGMYPRRRLEALADGIFGVAMTLLVLEIRIPDGVDPHTDRELLAVIASLVPKIWPYALSFVVLGARWREMIGGRPGKAPVSRTHVTWSLANLLLVTFVPFSTLVLGRYASLAPAVWLYSANLAGMAIASWRASRTAPAEERNGGLEDAAGLAVFLLSAAAAVALSFLHTPWAPMGFALNAAAPFAERLARRREAGAAA